MPKDGILHSIAEARYSREPVFQSLKLKTRERMDECKYQRGLFGEGVGVIFAIL